MEIVFVKETHCPACGHKMSAAASPQTEGDARPDPGDITICLYCETILCFTDDLDVRLMSPEEIREIGHEQQESLAETLTMVKSMKAHLMKICDDHKHILRD